MSTINLNLKNFKPNRNVILGGLLFITILALLGDLAFSVTTYHDSVIAVILICCFIYNLIMDIKEDKTATIAHIKQIFHSAKWLYIAVLVYIVCDIITMFYAKDIILALKKLPYMLEYSMVFIVGLYFCKTKKSLSLIMWAIACTGTVVSVTTYFYYGISDNPIYFQRLSTARDYNVYACLILFSFVILASMIINLNKLSYIKKLLVFAVAAVVNIPAFYFAGSRRIFIMIPYLVIFSILFDVIRIIFHKNNSISTDAKPINVKTKLLQMLSFYMILIVVYGACASALPLFSKSGAQKEARFKAKVMAAQQSGEKPPTNVPNSWEERTIENVIATIENKTMYSKRSIIYSAAFKELKTYSPLEIIFGRGSAYDIHMYDVTTDEDLLSAYSIDDANPREHGWLSVHNFMLADLLNGGIIKLALGLFLVVQVIIHAVKAIAINKKIAIAIIIPLSLVLVNNFISGAYGMLNDVFFHMFMLIMCGILYVEQQKEKEVLNAK